jgi:penicillin-binding protein 1A
VSDTRATTRDGKVLYQAPVQRRRVLPASIAREVTSALVQVVDRGTGINARIGRPVAGKTGTTDASSDAWFVGYTPQLTTAVWVGFADRQRSMTPPTTRITVTGGTWPAQIWQLYQASALAATPAASFLAPVAPSAATTTTTTTDATPALGSFVGMRLADAERVLVAGGFRVSTESQTSRAYPPGTVVAQRPAAGSAITAGPTVTLVLASGPPVQTAVPTLLGQLADQAAALLANAGLQVQIVRQQQPPPADPSLLGRVWKQSPASGTAVDQGSTVTVWVNPA